MVVLMRAQMDHVGVSVDDDAREVVLLRVMRSAANVHEVSLEVVAPSERRYNSDFLAHDSGFHCYQGRIN